MKRLKFIQLSGLATLSLSTFNQLYTSNSIRLPHILGLDASHLNKQHTLEQQTYKAYLKLKAAADQDGINLYVASGYRSFKDQKRIFKTKFKRYQKQGLTTEEITQKIITYSTIPGTSRHHWGTDIDLIDLNAKQPHGDLLKSENYHGNGAYCRLFEWMEKNASQFGFELVYTDNYHRKGFSYEPWHYSYQPVAQPLYKLQQSQAFKSAWSSIQFYGKSSFTPEFITAYFKNHLGDINAILK